MKHERGLVLSIQFPKGIFNFRPLWCAAKAREKKTYGLALDEIESHLCTIPALQ